MPTAGFIMSSVCTARTRPTSCKWCAHRVQRPHEKINHALVLGGKQGIGKDTLLEPVKYAVGPWNFNEVSPQQVLGRFNGFLKSVILRVSEARDLGEFDRFAFYDHMKSITAAPPDVLRIDEKNRQEYAIPNVCGVIITTNHKSDGIYLPADDRRHFVAWSDLDKSAFDAAYWTELWQWYERGGFDVVAHYLQNLDLTGFNPKAPPPQTERLLRDRQRLPHARGCRVRRRARRPQAGPTCGDNRRPSDGRARSSDFIELPQRTAGTAAASRTGSRLVATRRCGTRMPRTVCGGCAAGGK